MYADSLKNPKRTISPNINTKCVKGNRKFWKSLKSSFSGKRNNFKSITLVENDQIVSDYIQMANIFNDYFSNLVKNLKR